ncbi:MAG: Na/Pi symporter [Verrucomicrobiota bacterium]
MTHVMQILEIIGSLGLFLFGVQLMTQSLHDAAGPRFKLLLQNSSNTSVRGFITGFGVTALIQSSSVTTVILVGLVSAGLLTVIQAAGVILGANLGTTVTFWIVSFIGYKVSLSNLALPIIALALPLIFSKREKYKKIGNFILGFCILLLGLGFLKMSVPDVKSNTALFSFLQNFTGQGYTTYIILIVFGILLTFVVQSSSVAGTITIALLAKGWIDLPQAMSIVLGENIGTTITAQLASINQNTAAKQAAWIHSLFNVFGVLWVFLPLPFIASIIHSFNLNEAAKLALFHTCFNLLNALIVLPFIPLLTRVARFCSGSSKETG